MDKVEKAVETVKTESNTKKTCEKPIKKATTKAERRAIQEAQRLEKAERLGIKLPPVQTKKKDKSKETETMTTKISNMKISSNDSEMNITTTNTRPSNETNNQNDGSQSNKSAFDESLSMRSRVCMDDPRANKRINRKLNKQNIPIRTETTRKMLIFSHLKQYDRLYVIDQNINVLSSTIGYDFIVLGLQYSDGIIHGSTARSIALLMAIRNYIKNYKTPNDKVLSRDMEVSLRPSISFLNQCRPLAIGMGNIIKFVKFHISSLPYTLSEQESKDSLISKLDNFYQNRIINAHITIVNVIQSKINNGDVILTYASSSLVSDILVESIARSKRIKIIIVDSKPKFNGRQMLAKFANLGVDCTYIGINGISYVMKKVTKVLLGAHGLLANGAVITRVGSAMVTTVANAYNIPVFVCCESFKFSEKAQTDAIVYNELCDPHELITSTPNAPNLFKKWKDAKSVCLLNLSYDVILPKFISALVTELGMVPCTSAPIVVRMKNSY